MDAEHIPIDYDYEYYSEDSTSGYTLNSASTRFRYENGRTYHAYREGAYWGPNDYKSMKHEVIVHHLCLLTLRDRLFLAPVENPKRVLDLGTGSGLWATDSSDIADKFPKAKVIGVDLSQPPPEAQPDNLEFLVDDVASVWAYNDNFDFIHIRGLFGSIADWPTLYAEVFNHLHPGAYVEQIEWSVGLKSDDNTLPYDSVLAQWSRDAFRVGDLNGKTMKIAEQMADLMRQAGFVDIVEKRYKWPIGSWSSDPVTKKIGRWNVKNWEDGMEGWAMALYTRVMGWSRTDVDKLLQKARKALRNRKQHIYHEVRLVHARKPKD